MKTDVREKNLTCTGVNAKLEVSPEVAPLLPKLLSFNLGRGRDIPSVITGTVQGMKAVQEVSCKIKN